ncbi:MAG: type I methionyl aminopeptidase [Planctomycetota bacterium]
MPDLQVFTMTQDFRATGYFRISPDSVMIRTVERPSAVHLHSGASRRFFSATVSKFMETKPNHIELRSPREIRKMRRAGLVVWEAHQAAAQMLKPGVTTAEINEVFVSTFAKHQATSLFRGYGDPPFPAETCISVNEQVVHGVPGSQVIQEGDIVSLDTGCSVQGWCGDAAVTHAIGDIDPESRELLTATNDVLNLAIEWMDRVTTWYEIAEVMQEFILDKGYSIVRELTGHGIGRVLHEPPSVPNYLPENDNSLANFDIRPGLVIAVEPMVNLGTQEIECLDDEWTVVTADRKNSAHFEHTIAITREGPIRLTGPPDEEELAQMEPWLHDSSKWIRW